MAFQVSNSIPSSNIHHENDVGPRKIDSAPLATQKFAFQDRSNVMMLKNVNARHGKGTPVKPMKGGISLPKYRQDALMNNPLKKKGLSLAPLKIAAGAENEGKRSDMFTTVGMEMTGDMNDENLPPPERMYPPDEREFDFYSSLPDFELEKTVVHRDFIDEPLDSPYRDENAPVWDNFYDASWTV